MVRLSSELHWLLGKSMGSTDWAVSTGPKNPLHQLWRGDFCIKSLSKIALVSLRARIDATASLIKGRKGVDFKAAIREHDKMDYHVISQEVADIAHLKAARNSYRAGDAGECVQRPASLYRQDARSRS